MGFRAALVIAAAVLPRTVALRPRIRGGLPRRRVQDTCPVDDCCPGKLEPIFAAASGLATGGTKKQKPRGSSYKLEAGKRPPPPDSDSDDERPAAAVSRALEKLDDEEEGPPPYDFTHDKAKPAKHRSSVEVDELWPAAGAGAAAAANESKAPENDMDCDSDSDLGSRISLHAPM